MRRRLQSAMPECHPFRRHSPPRRSQAAPSLARGPRPSAAVECELLTPRLSTSVANLADESAVWTSELKVASKPPNEEPRSIHVGADRVLGEAGSARSRFESRQLAVELLKCPCVLHGVIMARRVTAPPCWLQADLPAPAIRRLCPSGLGRWPPRAGDY